METAIARIVDANFNRAREALRVMEEYARFVLDDPAGTQIVKELRHELAGVIGMLPSRDLLLARDTGNDVGTQLTTASETSRAGAGEVFTAAAKRLPEALRCLEEYLKTTDAGSARRIEAIRYRAYELEQRLALRSARAARFARSRLYVIITAALCRGDWFETARAAIDGGANCLQLREKGVEHGELLARARRLAGLCRERCVVFIVNDRPDLAVLSDADGVHVGQTDLSVRDARRIVGPERLVGVSTHNPQQLAAAIAEEPDYIAVGPMFASGTKPQAHIPGPELLRRACASTSIPIVPIGGIGPANAGVLVELGATRLCVCSAVIGAENAGSAAQVLSGQLPVCDGP